MYWISTNVKVVSVNVDKGFRRFGRQQFRKANKVGQWSPEDETWIRENGALFF